ncbi:DUF523 domain-containing protein [Aureibacter tunicatorum]|uniref:Uncharacterized protein YbbK (DUF523 family) n=1 Tax=Aureibacter tunicatorum TaxID=866807 RepID=A0AAE4BS03_9BACT|nr:DUF523 domain-containing protein [Aureibacter tunicatorum]MDR6240714.1 uncharacterized protein YbbK (DUF523 family) [Aureibacter tunicatorum]BDD06953.1 hypothetical protein AUTU_44360 [Aureibacter tunicatorum]
MKYEYLVSACLIGEKCRYDGNDNLKVNIAELVEQKRAIAVCPEELGGLPTPRPPAEIMEIDGEKRVVTVEGVDVTENFVIGAHKALEIAKKYGLRKAILKSKSPSCGSGLIYDGSFSRKLIKGNGIASDILSRQNIDICDENI